MSKDINIKILQKLHNTYLYVFIDKENKSTSHFLTRNELKQILKKNNVSNIEFIDSIPNNITISNITDIFCLE